MLTIGKKIGTGILAFVAGISGLYAQEFECGQGKMTEKFWEANPEYKVAYQKSAAQVKRFADQNPDLNLAKAGEPVIIPVVVHVIHDNGQANISDEQIKSAITDLNIRYRKENADTANTVAAFQDVAGDIGIEFRLATKDPSGQCTEGIVRYVDENTYSGDDKVKTGRQWDANRYLNIYTVRRMADPGVAGYAYFPGSASPAVDGIILQSNYMGTIGTSSPFRSFTLAHEAGHYLGLAHTWGPTNDPVVGTNCDFDDEVGDTPNTIGNRSCNLNAESCGSLDNVQNYMEYSYCSTMFTKGQRSRIFSFIAQNVGGRGSLTSVQNTVSTGSDYEREQYPTNICQVDIKMDLPSGQVCPGSPVQFLDNSFFEIVSWNWQFEGGEPATSQEENPIVTFGNSGNFDVTLTVTNENGQTETKTFTDFVFVAEFGALSYPIEENFYEPEMFDPAPDGWFTVENPNDNSFWKQIGTLGYNDDRCVVLEGLNRSNYLNEDDLISGVFEMPANANSQLSFYISHVYNEGQELSDILEVFLSTDCGDTWELVRTVEGEEIQTAAPSGDYFEPNSSNEWREITADISAFDGNYVRVKFKYTNKGGNNIFLDNLNISGTTSINDNANLPSLKVYPNPAKSNGSLVIAGSYKGKIQLLDNLGRVSYEWNTEISNSQKTELQLPVLDAGVYFIKTEGNNAITKSLIITK